MSREQIGKRAPPAGHRGFAMLGLAAITASAFGFAQSSIPEDPGPTWISRYNSTSNLWDEAYDLALSPDGGRAYVTGRSRSSSYDYATIAYDTSTGEELWVARYNGPGNNTDVAYALAVSPDGARIFVTGASWGADVTYDYATVAYSSSGQQLWVSRYNGPTNHDNAYAITLDPLGSRVYVTGSSNGVGGYDYATIAYSVATGAQLWVTRYASPSSVSDSATSIAVSPNGARVFVTGSSNEPSNYVYVTAAYSSATGTEAWVARYDGPGIDDRALAIAVGSDGSSVFVTGSSFATIAYASATGMKLWVNAGPGNVTDGRLSAIDVAYSLALSPDGSRVYVTGESATTLQTAAYVTVAYSSTTGTQTWLATYEGSSTRRNRALALAMSPDGTTIYVTGASRVGSIVVTELDNSDLVTIAYSAATGERRWIARYSGEGVAADHAYAIAVSPDGSRVYVTGGSVGPATSTDFVTIAYPAHTCVSGREEGGQVSGLVHEVAEAGPAGPYLHGINCDIVVPTGS